MRKINPETGKPYPRKRPMQWEQAFRIGRHRKAHAKIIADGFVECASFSQLPMTNNGGWKIIDATIHPDGTRLYVKMEAGWYAERQRRNDEFTAQQDAWRKQPANRFVGDYGKYNIGQLLGEAEVVDKAKPTKLHSAHNQRTMR